MKCDRKQYLDFLKANKEEPKTIEEIAVEPVDDAEEWTPEILPLQMPEALNMLDDIRDFATKYMQNPNTPLENKQALEVLKSPGVL